MSEGKCPFSGGAMSVSRCTGVVNRNHRRSTSCITLTSASWKTAQSVLHISQCDEKLSGLSTEQEAQLSPRDRAMRRVS